MVRMEEVESPTRWLRASRSGLLSYMRIKNGGADGGRTHDLFRAREALCPTELQPQNPSRGAAYDWPCPQRENFRYSVVKEQTIEGLEPTVGIEPTTSKLRISRSAN